MLESAATANTHPCLLLQHSKVHANALKQHPYKGECHASDCVPGDKCPFPPDIINKLMEKGH
jgi:hypothetical protein